MIKFVRIKINKGKRIFQNIQYLENIYKLVKKHSKYLNDDYSHTKDLLDLVLETVTQASPFFWVILSNEEFAGFVFLENIIGNSKHLHSGEITTAFEQKFWGKFTKKCAKKFIRYCFKKLKFKKLKSIVYEDNTRTEAILKACGMKFEAKLRAETLKNGKLKNIKIYSIIRGKQK